MHSNRHQQTVRRILSLLLIALLVLVRVVWLDSDAYARLSWSSALLTDEGFYFHNARNLVLFGHAHTDDFNNALIMPLLHVVQVGVFRVIGVGVIQARSISVVSSLLTLLVFFCAMRRAFSPHVAWLSLLLLGLDPVFTLYNRLALMDTPACLPLACAFYAWVRAAEKKEEKKRRGAEETWLFVCGMCLGLAYTVRGLAAIVLPVPFLLLLVSVVENHRLSGLRTRDSGQQALASVGRLAAGHSGGGFQPSDNPNTSDKPATDKPSPMVNCLSLLVGLSLILGVYALLWYLPHHQEIARANAYYLHHQLVPESLHHLWQNVQHALFGDDRGLSPYLFRHTPVTFSLCLLWLLTGKGKREKGKEGAKSAFPSLLPSAFLALWLGLTWAMLAFINYAPDRYYILFYPAMCGLAALALSDIQERLAGLCQSQWKRALLGSFLAYHLGEAILHHQSLPTEICLYAFTLGTLATLALFPPNVSQWRERLHLPAEMVPASFLLLWTLVALAWTGDWLRHIAYTQRDAGQWLATHLPADSVLIGDVAPGLCMNNRFQVVNVIPGLCNDQQPVERFAPAPRYIVILDAKFKEPWWRKNYPVLVAPNNRIHFFPRLIRLPVGVYAVETTKSK